MVCRSFLAPLRVPVKVTLAGAGAGYVPRYIQMYLQMFTSELITIMSWGQHRRDRHLSIAVPPEIKCQIINHGQRPWYWKAPRGGRLREVAPVGGVELGSGPGFSQAPTEASPLMTNSRLIQCHARVLPNKAPEPEMGKGSCPVGDRCPDSSGSHARTSVGRFSWEEVEHGWRGSDRTPAPS